jgi:two-component system chemotaxis response regulator CheY
MPNMNGAELVEYIRGIEKYQYIPVLLLSTETNEEKINKAYSAKITAWIKKPFELVEFQKIVKKALS